MLLLWLFKESSEGIVKSQPGSQTNLGHVIVSRLRDSWSTGAAAFFKWVTLQPSFPTNSCLPSFLNSVPSDLRHSLSLNAAQVQYMHWNTCRISLSFCRLCCYSSFCVMLSLIMWSHKNESSQPLFPAIMFALLCQNNPSAAVVHF